MLWRMVQPAQLTPSTAVRVSRLHFAGKLDASGQFLGIDRSSFVAEKDAALNQAVEQVTNTISVCLTAIEDRFDGLTV